MIETVVDSDGIEHKVAVYMGYQISEEEVVKMAVEMGYDLVKEDDGGDHDYVDVSLVKVPDEAKRAAGKEAFRRLRKERMEQEKKERKEKEEQEEK